ncbi:MAG: MmcQ/YjbR family DNA-binding protein [Propionibacteriaceae bacterium]|nr:MmcQ/YjbR family DNA-binding protein [Propionibacteriaceae bacterium]
MAVELKFDPTDPVFLRVRDIAMAFPDAQQKTSVGHATWFTRKVFLWWGMAHKVDGVWTQEPYSIAVQLPEDERLAVLEAGGYVPGYIGPFGWVGIRLDEGTDWEEIAELIEESFRMTAGKRLIAELDARSAS